MNSKDLKAIEKRAKARLRTSPEDVLKLVAAIRRLEKSNNTWRYSDGMRHPLDMD